MKRLLTILLSISLLVGVLAPSVSPKAAALTGSDFQPGRIMDDAKFFSAPTMSIQEIQAFLNAKVPVCDTNGTQPYAGTTRAAYSISRGNPPPFVCTRDYRENTVNKPAESGLCNGYQGANHSAAEIIYYVGATCGINSQVLLVLLQKEQSLITDDWPWPIQYRSATGYGCPDTAPCDTEYYGFFNQVYNAARQFKRYARDAHLFNYKANTNAYILYNPNAACGGTNVFIQNQATASLYNYTPYQPNPSALANLYGTGDGCGAYGNRNFWRMFNDWFGSTYGPPDFSCRSGANVAGVGTGPRVISNQFAATGPARLSLTIPNNTGTGCMEVHTWGNNQQAWITNVATNHPAIHPGDGEIISGNLYGDAKSELIFVKYRNTGSGRIEIHTWDTSYQRWTSNVATNYPAINPIEAKVIAADTNGDGIDELIFVKYRNTGSGRIEMHTWAPGYQAWTSNIASAMPQTESDYGSVIAGNVFGEGRDRLIFVKYTNTGSGKLEMHTWAPGYQAWSSNIASTYPSTSPDVGHVVAANIFGEGRDRLVYVKLSTTGSGRVEVHTWAPNYQAWSSNVATNYPAF